MNPRTSVGLSKRILLVEHTRTWEGISQHTRNTGSFASYQSFQPHSQWPVVLTTLSDARRATTESHLVYEVVEIAARRSEVCLNWGRLLPSLVAGYQSRWDIWLKVIMLPFDHKHIKGSMYPEQIPQLSSSENIKRKPKNRSEYHQHPLPKQNKTLPNYQPITTCNSSRHS